MADDGSTETMDIDPEPLSETLNGGGGEMVVLSLEDRDAACHEGHAHRLAIPSPHNYLVF